jgi:hypothetical protein
LQLVMAMVTGCQWDGATLALKSQQPVMGRGKLFGTKYEIPFRAIVFAIHSTSIQIIIHPFSSHSYNLWKQKIKIATMYSVGNHPMH